MDRKYNLAFIDGQNLYTGVKKDGRKIDFTRFRVYLKERLGVNEAFYYIGYYDPEFSNIYEEIENAGFAIIFKQQTKKDISQKKGNIDSDMIFGVMKEFIDNPEGFNQIIIVSGDGDFKILVDYLIKKGRFKKILFPNKKFASSVYKNKLSNFYVDYMHNLKKKIQK